MKINNRLLRGLATIVNAIVLLVLVVLVFFFLLIWELFQSIPGAFKFAWKWCNVKDPYQESPPQPENYIAKVIMFLGFLGIRLALGVALSPFVAGRTVYEFLTTIDPDQLQHKR